MAILREAEALLRAANFDAQTAIGDAETLQFEDANLLGFVAVHNTIADLLRSWQAQQDEFLRRNAVSLRRDPSKAWNIYAVFLTGDRASGDAAARLLSIEEDFRATRKIAQANVVSRADVQRALAPLLPLSSAGVVQSLDPDRALRDRLDAGERRLFDMIRRSEMEEPQIIAALLEEMP